MFNASQAMAEGLGLGEKLVTFVRSLWCGGGAQDAGVRGQVSVTNPMSGSPCGGFQGGRGQGVGPASPRLVVGPDARLPRTSPVTLDVLTG